MLQTLQITATPTTQRLPRTIKSIPSTTSSTELVNPAWTGLARRTRIDPGESGEKLNLKENSKLKSIHCTYISFSDFRTAGEPLHWSLFVAHEEGKGTICEVNGENSYMHYGCARDVDIMNLKSFHNAYQIW